MFGFIKSLFGTLSGKRPETRSGARRSPPSGQHASATKHLYQKDSPAMRRSKKPSGGDAPAPPKRKSRTDFDPYNTGKFDRGASWEKISKSQR